MTPDSAHRAQLPCGLGIFSTLLFKVSCVDNCCRAECWSVEMHECLNPCKSVLTINGYWKQLLHSQGYQSSVSSLKSCWFSSFCFFYSSSLIASFVHTAELELKILRLGTMVLARVPVHQGHWSVTTQRLLMQPVWDLENWVFDISVETCLLFLSNILFVPAVSRTQQLGQISPDIFTVLSTTNEVLSWKKRGWQLALCFCGSKAKEDGS